MNIVARGCGNLAIKNIAIPAAGFWLLAFFVAAPATAAEMNTDPSHYRGVLSSLKAGDTLNLAPGRYPRLTVSHLNGRPDAWITIRGPASGSPAVIAGESGYNTVEIINSSYVAIENLRIDSRGIVGAFGISAKDGARNRTHDIRIEGNILVGQGTDQQIDRYLDENANVGLDYSKQPDLGRWNRHLPGRLGWNAAIR